MVQQMTADLSAAYIEEQQGCDIFFLFLLSFDSNDRLK
jgi:hypothetical protein